MKKINNQSRRIFPGIYDKTNFSVYQSSVKLVFLINLKILENERSEHIKGNDQSREEKK